MEMAKKNKGYVQAAKRTKIPLRSGLSRKDGDRRRPLNQQRNENVQYEMIRLWESQISRSERRENGRSGVMYCQYVRCKLMRASRPWLLPRFPRI